MHSKCIKINLLKTKYCVVVFVLSSIDILFKFGTGTVPHQLGVVAHPQQFRTETDPHQLKVVTHLQQFGEGIVPYQLRAVNHRQMVPLMIGPTTGISSKSVVPAIAKGGVSNHQQIVITKPPTGVSMTSVHFINSRWRRQLISSQSAFNYLPQR